MMRFQVALAATSMLIVVCLLAACNSDRINRSTTSTSASASLPARQSPSATSADASMMTPTWSPDRETQGPTRAPSPYVPTFDTSGPPWPEPDNGICEVSIPISFPGIYLMNPDGSDVRQVIGRDEIRGTSVIWSPDGRSVTYVGSTPPEFVEPGVTPTADASGNIPGPVGGIFQRDIASGADRMLVAVDGADDLVWSADGRRLAFTQSEYVGSTLTVWIAVVNADGTGLRRLAGIPIGFDDFALSFADDQLRLAYMDDDDIWVMNADGSSQRKLTDTPEYEMELAWAPDGEVIFRAADGYQPADWRDDPYLLHSVRSDGTNLRVLEPFERGDRQPGWSPDGRQIAFSRVGEIWVMGADGSNPRNMTQHLSPDTFPDWSPDGSRILFRSLYRSVPGEIEEPRREPGQPRSITLRYGDAEQEGMFLTSCWVAGNSRRVGGSGAVAFPAEPLLVTASDDADATLKLDFSQLGEPGTLSIAVYDLAATRANGKGIGEDALILPCAAPGGVEESCRVFESVLQPGSAVALDLPLTAGDYVIIVHSNVVASPEYGYVEQAFHVRYGP